MSKKFIEKKCNSSSLDLAVRQQKQISYFITSEIQEETRIDYFEQYAHRKYYTNDVFLNWVKSVFKTENFLSFYKYYRNPNPSSKLINTRVKEPLTRVFFSEDSHFNYVINGKHIERPIELESDFERRLFDSVVFRYNDIIVHDLKDVNDPYRKFVSIDKVVSIEVERNKIKKIAYTGMINNDNGEPIYGYVYIDDEKYEFYTKGLELVTSEPHDYDQCPATFVVDDNFDNDPIVKQSIFSYVRGDLEEYCFLKTLQRMTHPNGAFPIVTKVKTREINENDEDFDNNGSEPMSVKQLGSQVSQEARTTAGSGKGNVLQAGTIIETPAIEKADGSIDMELSKHFLTFYHTPVEILEYISKRIRELENDIIVYCIGDYSEGNEASMTELQVSKGFVARDDKLRWLSKTLSFSRQASDKMLLSLKYGKDQVNVDIFYGSDFFLESQDKIYDMLKKSPNAIERKTLLTRLSQRRNMFNKEKQKREVILYKLLPYSSDIDFNLAVDKERVSDEIFEFQTRFNYWVAMFESKYGNITAFWDDLTASDSEKIDFINKLIVDIIKTDNNNLKTAKNGKEANNQA